MPALSPCHPCTPSPTTVSATHDTAGISRSAAAASCTSTPRLFCTDAERAVDPHEIGLALRVDVAQQLGDAQRELALLPLLAFVEQRAHATQSTPRPTCRVDAVRHARRRASARSSVRSCARARELARQCATSTRGDERRPPRFRRWPRRAVGARPARFDPSGRDAQAVLVVAHVEVRDAGRHAEKQQRRRDLRPGRDWLATTADGGCVGCRLDWRADGCEARLGRCPARRAACARRAAPASSSRHRAHVSRCASKRGRSRRRRARRRDTRRSLRRDRRISAEHVSHSVSRHLVRCSSPARAAAPSAPDTSRVFTVLSGQPDQIRDLLERQPVVFLQHDRRPLLLRAAAPSPAPPARVRSLRATRSSIDSDGSAAAASSIRSTSSGGCTTGVAPLAPHPVAAQIQRDPVQPRRELRLAAKPRQRAKRAEERLLAHVSRILFATDRAVREGIDGPFPSQDELVEAVGIAADRSARRALRPSTSCGARRALSAHRCEAGPVIRRQPLADESCVLISYSVDGPNALDLCCRSLAQTEPIAVQSRPSPDADRAAHVPRDANPTIDAAGAPRPASGEAGTAPRPLASLLAHGATPTDLLPHLHQHALDVTGGVVLAAVPAQSAQRRAAGDVGLRPRRAADRPLDARRRRSGAGRRRVRAPRADAGRRRGPADAGSGGAARHARRRCCCRSCAASERVGLLAIGFDAAPPTSRCRRRRRPKRPTRSSPRSSCSACARASELQRDVRGAARRVRREPVGDAEPGGGPRHLLPRRQPAVRRRPHVGLDPRSPRASSRAAGLLRSRSDVARGVRVSAEDAAAAGGGRRCAATRAEIIRHVRRRRRDRASSPCRCAAAAARSARSSSKACASRPAASSTCSIAPTSSAASCRAPSRTCSCSTTSCGRGASWRTPSTRSPTSSSSPITRGHIVHVNQAFATRVGRTREELLDRPLADYIGPELAAWLERHERRRRGAHRRRGDACESSTRC